MHRKKWFSPKKKNDFNPFLIRNPAKIERLSGRVGNAVPLNGAHKLHFIEFYQHLREKNAQIRKKKKISERYYDL